MVLAKLASALARIINFATDFIVQATVIMIINYNQNTFIVQATGERK
jgi:hypothetical protein